ncbi:MAG: type II toxin-antitoxin system HicA family toxin [Candidatus Brocadia sp.]|nr:type II toxin-antitoxin system HicA family toxin [Candidatus Brocadia sp.]
MSYKRVKIIRALKEYGFEFLREGGNHTIFTNGEITVPVGRRNEISPKNCSQNSERNPYSMDRI